MIAAILAQEPPMSRDHIPEWAGARSYTDPMKALRDENATLRTQLTEARRVLRHVLSELKQTTDWGVVDDLQAEIAAVLAQEAQR